MNVARTIQDLKIKALLFDCDGTIADSMPVHYRAWASTLSQFGCTYTEAQHQGWAGRPTARIVEMLNEEQGLSMRAAEVAHAKELLYLEKIGEVAAVGAILTLVHEYRGVLPMAVVSGSPRDSVIRTLTHLGILEAFETIVGAEDYAHGKPAPECFLTAAAQVNVAPSDCLVFEDADLGIRAAHAAGMKCVRVDPQQNKLDMV